MHTIIWLHGKLFESTTLWFRKAHSTQHALFRLIQSWQRELDESGFVETILVDLSKAYDYLPHDLMVAKVEAYDISKESLQLISDYLS